MATRFAKQIGERRIELVPLGLRGDGRVELVIDGEVVDTAKPKKAKLSFVHDDLAIEGKPAWHEMSILRADISVAGGQSMPMAPEPGSRQAKQEKFARDHPELYAARHVAKGVGEVAIGIIGFGFLLRYLPAIPIDIPTPSFSLPSPDISLPSIDLPTPDIPLPDLPALPGWVQGVVDSTKILVPIVIGVVLAVREYRKRQERVSESGDESNPE